MSKTVYFVSISVTLLALSILLESAWKASEIPSLEFTLAVTFASIAYFDARFRRKKKGTGPRNSELP